MKKLESISDYYKLIQSIKLDTKSDHSQVIRYLCRTDLFFLLWFGLGRHDIAKPWLFDRCREVQLEPNGRLDLWARAHYKSTIITYGKTIQDILSSHGDDPLKEWEGKEVTVGIFSCTRPIAKGFLRQIKREFTHNQFLKKCFPDIIWEQPTKDAPKWSDDDGLILKRKSNPKESTIEAWGLVDGQPTSKHFLICVYDDVITKDSVRSPHMIAKVTESWELSINLGTEGGIRRYIGTRYHFNDTYKTIMDRNAAIPRVYTATKDGEIDGPPVLLTSEDLAEKRRVMGIYTFSTQMMQNPTAGDTQGFDRSWVLFYSDININMLNVYILVDPANEKKKTSDYTAIIVIGLGQDENYYVIDMIRDRLNLTERAEVLFKLHKKYKPISVGYERYGMQADISHFNDQMQRYAYHFKIIELKGAVSKNDRIRSLIPLFESGRIFFPYSCVKTNYEKKTVDLVDQFIEEELSCFPVSVHDDMLDAMSRILDEKLEAFWPIQKTYLKMERRKQTSGWAS